MHFKFSPNILSRLGEELIPNPDQGIMELVKNAYDADATECTVKLFNTESPCGDLEVSDNGVGMDLDKISDGWLVIGRSQKIIRQPTPKLQRLPVGDKGLGRLAALRQGSEVILKTRPANEPGVEYSLSICWEDFSEVNVVEDVILHPKRTYTEQSHGTDIVILNLSFKLGKREIKRLARELVLLADPFTSKAGFRPKLIAPGFTELEKRVQESYFQDTDYHLYASLNADGKAEAKLMDWKENILFQAEHKDIAKHENSYGSIEATIEVWVFRLNPQSFSRRERIASIAEIRSWLSVVGGVHLYHRGLRVQPYGDPGNDWLGINLERAKATQERPSTNTLIGRVMVEDPCDILVQKTDRLGFIEDQEFSKLKQFAIDAFHWMAGVRQKEAEEKRETSKRNIDHDISEAKVEVEETIKKLDIPSASKEKILTVVQKYERAREHETKILREDILLYRSLATAGTTASIFAHESGKPVTLVEKSAKKIAKQGYKLLGEDYEKSLGEPVNIIRRAANSLKGFAKFPIYLLKRTKRQSRTVNVHEVIHGVIDLFDPFLREAKVIVGEELVTDHIPSIRGSTALLEAILVNLMTNALNSFNVQGALDKQREIKIRTNLIVTHLELRFLDNGSGIQGLELDEIWLPGRTTTSGGTGLGLTIVKDSVIDLDGEIWAIPNGEIGGAEFVINLPLVEDI